MVEFFNSGELTQIVLEFRPAPLRLQLLYGTVHHLIAKLVFNELWLLKRDLRVLELTQRHHLVGRSLLLIEDGRLIVSYYELLFFYLVCRSTRIRLALVDLTIIIQDVRGIRSLILCNAGAHTFQVQRLGLRRPILQLRNALWLFSFFGIVCLIRQSLGQLVLNHFFYFSYSRKIKNII